MTAVLAVDEKTGREVRAFIPGRVVIHRGAELADVPPEDWEADGPAQLIALVLREQPQVVAIDISQGGSRYSSAAAALVLLRLWNPPAVVLICPRRDAQLTAWSEQVGAWGLLIAPEPVQLARAVKLAAAWMEGLADRDALSGALAPVLRQRVARPKKTQATG